MTTPPDNDEPPRGGTPLDDAVERERAGDRSADGGADLGTDTDRPLVADGGADDGGADSGAVQDDPTTETDEDPRFA